MTLPLIQLVDIKKSFGTNHVLKGVNLSIFKGEIMAVIGKSGTGKSVLLKHIIGLILQDSGKLLIRGEPLHHMPKKERLLFKKELSYMFQENALFDFMNIFENIALPLTETSQDTKSIIEEVASLIKKIIPENVKFKLVFECGNICKECKVKVAGSKIHQVLMNLCTNSLYAMKETGGSLEICSSRERIEKEEKFL